MTLPAVATKPRLFGDFERTDNSPIALRELFYSLINPFNGRRAEQSRERCNCWCADYARDTKEDAQQPLQLRSA